MSRGSCVECWLNVREKQQGLKCDVCLLWQHRTCNSGISQVVYRQSVREKQAIRFTCRHCTQSLGKPVPEYTLDLSTGVTSVVEPTSFVVDGDLSIDVREEIVDSVHPTILEESEDEESVLETFPVKHHIDYTIIEGGSQRQKNLLNDSDGYSYIVKKVNKTSTHWRCTCRSQRWFCYATVRQVGNNFISGPSEHNHLPVFGMQMKKQIYAKVRQMATQYENAFRPTSKITEEAILECTGGANVYLPKKDALQRMANRARAKVYQDNTVIDGQ